MCGPPDFSAVILMVSRLIYFGGAIFTGAVVYKNISIIKERFNNFVGNSKKNYFIKPLFSIICIK